MKTWTLFGLVLGSLLLGFWAKFPQQLGTGRPLHGFGPIHGDGEGYYAYLPAFFLNHDLVDIDPEEYESGRDFLTHPAFIKWPETDRYLNKYPPGVAILVVPFFGLAVLISAMLSQPVDGYNLIFQFLAGMAALVYVALGTMLLYKIYRRFFNQRVALMTVLGLVLATNLWHYTVFDSLYSHAFAFFATCMVIALTVKWYEKPQCYLVSFLLGLSLGVSFVIRNANAWIGLFVLGYSLVGKRDVAKGVSLLLRRWQSLLLVGVGILIAIAPQLAYFRAVTSHWWVYSYPGVGFSWLDPAWYGVLFSPRRGLFFWTPLLLLGVVGGPASLKKRPVWFWPVVASLAVQTYLVASWSQWWFGDGLGHRAFIDGYPLWGFLIAAGITHARRLSKWGTYLFGAACIVFNLMATGWYWGGTLPRDHVTWSRLLQLLMLEGPRFSWLVGLVK